MPFYEDLDHVNRVLEAHDNVLSISMEDLRNAHGEERLGKYVRASISLDLKRMAIGHHPSSLPSYQEEYVVLYKVATPAADLIDSILQPVSTTDRVIRDAISHKATEVIRKIKMLVEDEDD